MEKIVQFNIDPEDNNLHIKLIDRSVNITNMDIYELFEYQLCNGWNLVQPEQIGALTEAPILSDDIAHDDNGNIENIGTIYWFPDYMIIDFAKQLLEKGETIFVREDK